MAKNDSSPMSIAEYEEFMELVFAYTAAAHDFGFAHKMNNRFTALSMNATFLLQALSKEDLEKANAKAAQVAESITNLVSFSQQLVTADWVPSESAEHELNELVEDSLNRVLGLPTFEGLGVTLDIDTAPIQTALNPAVPGIFFYSYLKHCKRHEYSGNVQIKTAFDAETRMYSIVSSVGEIKSAPPSQPESAALAFPSAGEMPLRYLARVIRNVSPQFELITHEDRPLDLELEIRVKG